MKASRKGTRLNDQQYFKQPPPHLRQRMTPMCVLPNISGLRDKIQVTETQISISQRQERRLLARTRGKSGARTGLETRAKRTGREDGGRGATTQNTIHLKNKSRELARYSYGAKSNEESATTEEEKDKEDENERWCLDETTARVAELIEHRDRRNAEEVRRSRNATKNSVRRAFGGTKRSSDKASQHWDSALNARRMVGVDKCVDARDSDGRLETRRSSTERPRRASGKGDTSFSFPWTTKKEATRVPVEVDGEEQRDEYFHRVKKTTRYEHLETASKQPAGRFKQIILEFLGLFAIARKNQPAPTKWESREAPRIETLYHRMSRTKRRRRSTRTATIHRSGGDQCAITSNSQFSYPTSYSPAPKANTRTKTRRVSNNGSF